MSAAYALLQRIMFYLFNEKNCLFFPTADFLGRNLIIVLFTGYLKVYVEIVCGVFFVQCFQQCDINVMSAVECA